MTLIYAIVLIVTSYNLQKKEKNMCQIVAHKFLEK
jgi:hypothetical protein